MQFYAASMRRSALVGLLVLGLAGSFPRLLPPSGAGWTRSGSNPLISAVAAWEETSVAEQNVTLEDGLWKMWYTGGWAHGGMGYATSLDGITWTKYASNPVYGQGGSGYANFAASPEVIRTGSTYYLFISGGATTTDNRSTFRVATSTDGLAWTTQTSSISLPAAGTLWGNRAVWLEGSAWKMLQEVYNGTIWRIYLYTSSDGLTWSVGNSGNPLTTLQIGSGMYGGPTMARQDGITIPKRAGVYEIWYHAAPSGLSPTNIYRATSSDLITWTPTSAVLTHTGSGDELDQIADPSVIVVGSVAYLYYDATINATETSKVMLATGPATP